MKPHSKGVVATRPLTEAERAAEKRVMPWCSDRSPPPGARNKNIGLDPIDNASVNQYKRHRGINLQGLSREAVYDIYKVERATVRRYGFPPLTKEVAAAHEAGHVIVAHSLGDEILGARLLPANDGSWLGRNDRSDRHNGKRLLVPDNPQEALVTALIMAAGFSGEMLANHAHPSSSIDERMQTQWICSELDGVLGRPAGITEMMVDVQNMINLRKHEMAFDAIRKILTRDRILRKAVALRILKNVEPFDLAGVFRKLSRRNPK